MASFEKRGSKYRAVVSYTDANGVHQKTSKTFPTKKLATVWASEMETKINGGLDINAGKITLPDYYKQWVETYKVGTIREATLKTYMSHLANVTVLFSELELDNLTTATIQQKLNVFAQSHSRSYTRIFVTSLKSALKDAYLDGLIQRDIYSRLKATGNTDIKPDNFLSVADFEKLRDYLYDHADDMSTTPFLLMSLIALETGARSGEIQGLNLNDIHSTFIDINKSYSASVNKVTDTKNISSVRQVTITNELSIVLNEYIKNLEQLELFPHKYSAKTISVFLKRLTEEVGIPPIRFHGLRHSHVSYLLHNGVDIQYISKRVGHKNVTITLSTYAHMLKEKELAQNELALKILSKK